MVNVMILAVCALMFGSAVAYRARRYDVAFTLGLLALGAGLVVVVLP